MKIYILIPKKKASSLSLYSPYFNFGKKKVQSTKSVVIMVDCGFLADCRLLEQQYRKLTIIEFYFVFFFTVTSNFLNHIKSLNCVYCVWVSFSLSLFVFGCLFGVVAGKWVVNVWNWQKVQGWWKNLSLTYKQTNI